MGVKHSAAERIQPNLGGGGRVLRQHSRPRHTRVQGIERLVANDQSMHKTIKISPIFLQYSIHRLNMELDLQSFFGLHVHSCTHWLRPRNPPSLPRNWTHIRVRGRYWSAKIETSLCDTLVKGICILAATSWSPLCIHYLL